MPKALTVLDRLREVALKPDQVTLWRSIPTVTAATAIRHCLEMGVPTDLIRQAIERSARPGIVPTKQREELAQLMKARNVG